MEGQRLVRKVHRRQAVRHVVANKIQLALTVLRELEDGRVVPRKLAERAIKNLEEIMRFMGGRKKF